MKKLYVGNIPFTASEEDLRGFFKPYTLSRVTICTDRETGRPRGFAFVELDEQSAQSAIASHNNTELGGRTVVVNEAVEKFGDRAGGAGGGGNRRGGGGGGGGNDRRSRGGGGNWNGDRRRSRDSDYE